LRASPHTACAAVSKSINEVAPITAPKLPGHPYCGLCGKWAPYGRHIWLNNEPDKERHCPADVDNLDEAHRIIRAALLAKLSPTEKEELVAVSAPQCPAGYDLDQWLDAIMDARRIGYGQFEG
jgi:hypothetical protein